MFIVLLKFSDNKARAGQFMEAHMEWIKRGFDAGVLLLTGSIKPNLGGGVMAYNISLAELKKRVNEDPFIIENIVSAEIIEISPLKADERLDFLVD